MARPLSHTDLYWHKHTHIYTQTHIHIYCTHIRTHTHIHTNTHTRIHRYTAASFATKSGAVKLFSKLQIFSSNFAPAEPCIGCWSGQSFSDTGLFITTDRIYIESAFGRGHEIIIPHSTLPTLLLLCFLMLWTSIGLGSHWHDIGWATFVNEHVLCHFWSLVCSMCNVHTDR